MGPEPAVAIVVNKKTGAYDVTSRIGTGEVGQATTGDLGGLAQEAVKAGFGVVALGHAHLPTGSPNFLVDGSGKSKALEGASVADAINYKALGIPADRLFVLASEHIFVFGGNDSFISYPWKP